MKVSRIEYRRNLIFIVIFLAVILLSFITANAYYNWDMSRMTLFDLSSGAYGGILSILMTLAIVCFLFIDKIRPQKSMVGNPRSKKHMIFTIGYFLLYGLIYIVLLKIGVEMFGTLSRASILAVSVGGAVVCWEFYGVTERIMLQYHTRRWVVIGYVTGILLILIGGAAVWLYKIKELSANGRFLMWKMQIQTIIENPMGVGREFFQGAIAKTQEDYFRTEERVWEEQLVAGAPEDGFNEFLQIGIEQGVIGMFLFLMLFVTAFYLLKGKQDIVSIATKGGLITFLVFSCFSYPLSTWQITIMVIVLLLMATPKCIEHWQTKSRTIVWIVAVVGFCAYYLTPFIQDENVYKKWEAEQVYFNSQIFEGTVDNYKELYPFLKHDGQFLFEYGQCLSKTGNHKRSIEVLKEGVQRCGDPMLYNIMGKGYQALGDYQNAEECYWRAYYRIPHRFYPLYLLSLLYAEQGRMDKCLEIRDKIMQMPEKIPSTAIDKMKKEVNIMCSKQPFVTHLNKTTLGN